MRPYRGIPIDKPIDCGEFVYGWLVESGGHSYIIVGINPTFVYKTDNIVLLQSYLQVHPSTVGQQIGIPDRNGVEIYKGDRVIEIFRNYFENSSRIPEDCQGRCRQEDVYEGTVIWWDSGWFLDTIENGHIALTDGADELIVIGNIHDKETKDETQKDA